MVKNHTLLYLAEFFIIGGGFAYLLTFKLPIYTQFWILGSLLTIYIVMGLVHHSKHRNINTKVVLEYILVSALVFALFIFLNISRL